MLKETRDSRDRVNKTQQFISGPLFDPSFYVHIKEHVYA